MYATLEHSLCVQLAARGGWVARLGAALYISHSKLEETAQYDIQGNVKLSVSAADA